MITPAPGHKYLLGVTRFLRLIISTNFYTAEFSNPFKKDTPTEFAGPFNSSLSTLTGKMSVVSADLTILNINLVSIVTFVRSH